MINKTDVIERACAFIWSKKILWGVALISSMGGSGFLYRQLPPLFTAQPPAIATAVFSLIFTGITLLIWYLGTSAQMELITEVAELDLGDQRSLEKVPKAQRYSLSHTWPTLVTKLVIQVALLVLMFIFLPTLEIFFDRQAWSEATWGDAISKIAYFLIWMAIWLGFEIVEEFAIRYTLLERFNPISAILQTFRLMRGPREWLGLVFISYGLHVPISAVFLTYICPVRCGFLSINGGI